MCVETMVNSWGFCLCRPQSNIDENPVCQAQISNSCSEHIISSLRFRSKETLVAAVCVTLIALSYLALASKPSNFSYGSIFPVQIRSFFGSDDDGQAHPKEYQRRFEEVFEKAAMPNRTVIITTLNAAWAENNSIFDLFLESFHHGAGTERLLKHLIIVCLDEKAYTRCVKKHSLCLKIKTGGVNFSGEQELLSADYVKMIWRRIKFLKTVLEMNYSFVFTDADVLWLRDPFPKLQKATADAEVQIACDRYNGDPKDVNNAPNAGFVYTRANDRTVKFYKYWYRERKRDDRMADQEVLNEIKREEEYRKLGLQLRFLDTQFFGGFCAMGTTDLQRAVTMHANCCKGLAAKVADLAAALDDWKKFYHSSSSSSETESGSRRNVSIDGALAASTSKKATQFRAPWACPRSWLPPPHS